MKLPLSHDCLNDDTHDEDWPESILMQLDDTQPFTAEQIAAATSEARPTLRAFPAPPSERRVRAA